MKTRIFWLLTLHGAFTAVAQNHSMDWYKIASGGGTGIGGVYTVSGTIGQHDATSSAAMTSVSYSLTWRLLGAGFSHQRPACRT